MPNDSCEISVIVATYNRGPLLREHIDSVLAQDFADYEAVYVDDSSTDGTPDILAQYEAAHPERLRVLQVSHGGQGAARNAGAQAARGRYLLFTDDDVTVPGNWLTEMLRIRAAQPCDAVSGGFAPFSLDTPVERYLHHRMRILFGDRPKYVTAAPTMSLLIPRDLFWEAGGFVREPNEDWVLCQEMTRRGHRLFYDPSVQVVHRYQTKRESAAWRLRVQGAAGIYDRMNRGQGALYLAYSTAVYVSSPVWSLWRFPIDLYPLSLRMETAFYAARLKAYLASFAGRRLGPPDWWRAYRQENASRHAP